MWPHQSPFPLTRMLEVSKHEESKMAENGETADRSSSSSMVIEEELPSFLNALIDKVEQITKLNSSSYEDIHINICELDKTVSLFTGNPYSMCVCSASCGIMASSEI